jgi:predicted ATPase
VRADLPSGTVTFLLTDVEGSTKLLHELGAERYAQALAEHRRVVRAVCADEGGVEVDTQGDAFFFAFSSAFGAVAAAQAMTEALAPGPIHLRIGLHTGAPLVTDEGYVGGDVHLAARIAASGHGGQVVLSKATCELVDGLSLTDLGEHRLKDVDQPMSIFQVGSKPFPPLKTISNTNLPRPASSFIGREAEVQQVLMELAHGARLLTLTGPGGSGKTRLALEVATTLIPAYSAGVFWIGLASLRDPALVTDAIAQTLGARGGLADHIGEREMLLLLDNLEQVIEAAPELATILGICPNLTLLVTSRERLHVRGEVEFEVPPLASREAVSLFCERSRLEPSEVIAELCTQLDELPLALELAAARTKALSPAQILERFSRRLDLLRAGRDAEPRQQTLRATIDWSYDLLSAEEQRVFRALSLFAGGCRLESAEDVVDAEVDTLQSLVEKSLLRFSSERYWMLETVREYSRERLAESELADHLVRRLRRHLVDLAYVHGAPNFRERSSEAYERLELEHANVRTVMDWAQHEQQPRDAAEVVAAWALVWISRGHTTEAAGWVPMALRARGHLPADVWMLVLMGCEQILVFGPGDFAQARVLMEEALNVLPAVETSGWLEASVLSELSAISRHEGRLKEARLWAERSLEVRVAHGLGTVRSLADLASLALAENDLDRSEQLLIQARDIFGRDGPHRNVAVASRQLGEVERRRGNNEKAMEHVIAALRGFAHVGEQASAGECLEDLARLEREQGHLERAARLWVMGQTLWLAGGAPVRNPLFPAEIEDLPDIDDASDEPVSLEEALEYALGPTDSLS